MSDLDVVPIPGYPGKWARRVVVDAWQKAGSPRILWAGRTYAEQKHLFEMWKRGEGNAADNPDANTRQPHVRGLALDLARYTPAIVRRMENAGFTRPIWRRNGFSQDEPWHFEPKLYVGNMRGIPKVTAAPSGGDPIPFDPNKEDDMFTDEDRAKLDAVYAALFGARNLTGKADPIRWVNKDGDAQQSNYGLLPIAIHNQELIARSLRDA